MSYGVVVTTDLLSRRHGPDIKNIRTFILLSLRVEAVFNS